MSEPIPIREEHPLRVLVEAPTSFHWAVKEVKSLPGAEVSYCAGPSPYTDLACPVTAGRACPRATEADVVVAALGLDTPEGRSIVQGMRDQHPALPMVLLAWPGDMDWVDTEVEGVETVVFPWTVAKVHAAIARAVAEG